MPTLSNHQPLPLLDLPGALFSTLCPLEGDEIPRGLAWALERVVASLDADGATLTEIAEDGSDLTTIAASERAGRVSDAFGLYYCPSLVARILRGETIAFEQIPEEIWQGAPVDASRQSLGAQQRSILLVPVALRGRPVCALEVFTLGRSRAWTDEVQRHTRFVADLLAATLHRRTLEGKLQQATTHVAELTERFAAEAHLQKEEIRSVRDFDEIVGTSAALRAALDGVRQVASTDSTVLLLGETGTGKELFARAIHDRSPRRNRPIVCVNCASLPPSLIESELFGHERGAFTGAVSMRQGRFEVADRGTIFLDEIGDLPLDLQAKLLRVLQEREFERLGSSARRKVDVRVIAATHRNLKSAVADGRFRADLYYRLSVFPVRLPPLRERSEDIPMLVWFIINERQRRLHKRITRVTKDAMDALQQYDWPGNVRELENVVERAMIQSTTETLRLDESFGHDRRSGDTSAAGSTRLEAVERVHIESILRSCHGRINGAGNAAEQLGLHPNTLRFRMRKLGIVRQVMPRAVRQVPQPA